MRPPHLCAATALVALASTTLLAATPAPAPDPGELRAQLSELSEAEKRHRLSRLWEAEFAAAPIETHAALRERVRKDLAGLRTLELVENEAWWNLLLEGWTLVGDLDELRSAEDAFLHSLPCVPTAAERRMERWRTSRGLTSPTLSPDVARDLFVASEGWIEICPDILDFSFARFYALSFLPSRTPEATLEAAELLIRHWEIAERKGSRMSPSPDVLVAEVLLDSDLEVDRAKSLLEAARGRLHLLLSTDRQARRAEIDALEAVAFLQEGDPQAADRLVDQIEASATRLTDPASPDEKAARARVLAAASLVRGYQAELAEELEHAAHWYAQALPERPRLALRISRLVKKLEDGPESAALRPSEDLDLWEDVHEPLPGFDLVDLDGASWTQRDFDGRVVLLSFWATWCGPCRQELPTIQSLHETTAGDDRVLVLTFNVDENPGLVAPTMKREGWTFPTILAEGLDARPRSIPETWIIDPEGIIRHRHSGFRIEHAESWLSQTWSRIAALSPQPPRR